MGRCRSSCLQVSCSSYWSLPASCTNQDSFIDPRLSLFCQLSACEQYKHTSGHISVFGCFSEVFVNAGHGNVTFEVSLGLFCCDKLMYTFSLDGVYHTLHKNFFVKTVAWIYTLHWVLMIADVRLIRSPLFNCC